MAIDTTSPRTRRAILLGAIGGVAASVATAVGRTNPVSAANGDYVQVGYGYSGTATTEIHVGRTTAFVGDSDSQAGIYGRSNSGDGVRAYSNSGSAVSGYSPKGIGVYGTSYGHMGIYGESTAKKNPAIFGASLADYTGVQGHSGTADFPSAAPARTGVYGYANQNASAVGVYGKAPKGRGVVASGGKAQLRLKASAAATHPTSGLAGDLFFDRSYRLWLCKGGTTWARLDK